MPEAQSAVTLARRISVRSSGRTLGFLSRRAALGSALLVAVLAHAEPALADRPMSTRFSTNTTGNIAFAANTLMVCPAAATTPTPGCTAARNTPAISSGTVSGLNNNNYNMEYVNTAQGTVPTALGTRPGSPSFDSSSATLSLPQTATVLFAGLYWGADTSKGATQTNGGPTPAAAPNPAARNLVGFQVPRSVRLHDDPRRRRSTAQRPRRPSRYGAFADVTSMVQAAGAGTYRGCERSGRHRRRPVRGLDARRRLSGPQPAAAQPDRRRRLHHRSVGVAADHYPGVWLPHASVRAGADDPRVRRV